MTNTEVQARWRANNRERSRAIVKKATQKFLFGGNREIAIQRDGEKCVSCSMTREEHRQKYNKDITVDHIDGNGLNATKKNNALDNLQTLCLPCHGAKDRKRLKNLGTRKIDEAAVKHIISSRGKILQSELAELYNITQATVSVIQSRKTWKHIK